MLEKYKVHKGLHYMFKLRISHGTTRTKLSSSKGIQPGSCIQPRTDDISKRTQDAVMVQRFYT